MTIAIEKLQEKTNTTRTNWPRKVRELILDSDSWSQGFPGVGLQGPTESRDRPADYKGVKGWAYRVPGGQGVGLQGELLQPMSMSG